MNQQENLPNFPEGSGNRGTNEEIESSSKTTISNASRVRLEKAVRNQKEMYFESLDERILEGFDPDEGFHELPELHEPDGQANEPEETPEEGNLLIDGSGAYVIRLPHVIDVSSVKIRRGVHVLLKTDIMSIAQENDPLSTSYRLVRAAAVGSGSDTTSLFEIEPSTGMISLPNILALPNLDARQTRGVRTTRYIYTHTLPEYSLEAEKTYDGNTQALQVRILPARLYNPDCFLLPEDTLSERVDKWRCVNLQPIYPREEFITSQEHISSLPNGLSYPKGKYRLIFNDEFETEGEDIASRLAFWNLRNQNCVQTRNSHLVITQKNDLCGAAMDTIGKFEYTYGYIEVKVTEIPEKVVTPPGKKGGCSVLSWPRHRTLPDWLDQYIIHQPTPAAQLKSLLSLNGAEMDLMEFYTTGRVADFVIHWGYEGGGYNHTAPRCQSPNPSCDIDGGIWIPHPYFSPDPIPDEPAYIFGVEWTPKGYRFFKSSGYDWLREHYRNANQPLSAHSSSYFHYGIYHAHNTGLYGYAGETTYPNVSDSDLYVREGISHTPQHIQIAKSSGNANPPYPEMRIDYVRVYQPLNRYKDMTPFYR